ncbi:MAG: MlaD family protein [Candidatus Stygibacter australis]|nr:MlaD family protein [Candidatus Stygibacter australis]MDP8322664.1 MlaD family protein [Candidatus Stygibacter australis]
MVGRAQKVRLGIFITLLSALLIAALIFIAGDKLMESWDYYYITYSDVSVNGLQVGGQVRYHGIEIGKVEEIKIVPDDVTKVRVKISVTEGTPVKTDTEAHLVLVGITGLKIVELTGGSNETLLLKPGSEILPGISILDNISGKAEVMAEKLELIMNNILEITDSDNQDRISSILTSVDTILIANREPINNIVVNLDSTTAELTELLHTSNEILARFNSIIQSGTIDTMLINFKDISSELNDLEIAELIDQMNLTVRQINSTVSKIDLTIIRSQQDLLDTISSMREVADYLEDFSRRISEDPTILLRGGRN